MKISQTLYDMGYFIARRIPVSLARPMTLPIIYQARVADSFVCENGNMLNNAFGYCSNNKIEGDYAEFGVFNGRTTIEAWRASKRHGLHNMNFWMFDSFRGLPEISGEDEGGPFEKGEFSCGRVDVENNLKRNGVAFERLHTVEGFYDESLVKTETDRKFSIVWIDCDLYESTVPVLSWLTNRLVDGAVLCFDDWFCFNGRPDKGQQKATKEWLARNPQITLMPYRDFHWAGKAFLAHKSQS